MWRGGGAAERKSDAWAMFLAFETAMRGNKCDPIFICEGLEAVSLKKLRLGCFESLFEL